MFKRKSRQTKTKALSAQAIATTMQQCSTTMKAFLVAMLLALTAGAAALSPQPQQPAAAAHQQQRQQHAFLEIMLRPQVAISSVTSAISKAVGLQKLPTGLTVKDMLTTDAWLPHKDPKTKQWVPGYLSGDKLKARMSMLCLWDLPAPEKWLWLKATSPLPLPQLNFAKMSNTTVSSIVMAPLSLGTGLMVAASHGPQDLKALADALPSVLTLPLSLSATNKGLPSWLTQVLTALQSEPGSLQAAGQSLLKELFTSGGSASSLLAHRRLMAATAAAGGGGATPGSTVTLTALQRGPIATLVSAIRQGGASNKSQPVGKPVALLLPGPLQQLIAPLADVNITAHDPVKMVTTLMQEFVGLVQKQITTAGTAQLQRLHSVGEKLTTASFNILNAARVDVLQGSGRDEDIDVLAGLAAVPRQVPLMIDALMTLMLPPGALQGLQDSQPFDLTKLPGAADMAQLVEAMVKGIPTG